ncbi:hypothetical protein BKA64DRAFT_340285 [Cadophora sp. MPI-SDFR-AT-0126]|nr:hypothetical protein BKA64DRAFT_340285 [Leotiomycetes sp. MPI-SDFR-AT-0126]
MFQNLNGKTILITGASSGIGRSTAIEFARSSPHSLRLILTARRLEILKEVAAEINAAVGDGVKVLPVQLDVSRPENVHGFVERLPEEWRGIHVLVNNAGLAVGGMAKSPDISPADINIMFATNVTGLINMTQAILPIMLRRNKGDIINLNSIAGHEAYPGGSIYCTTKSAVRSYSDALRRELIGTRIRVMEVAPGQVETEFSVMRFGGDREAAAKVYEGCDPLTPEDVAEVIVFQASRRENVVVADVLLFPSHQASATMLHRKT